VKLKFLGLWKQVIMVNMETAPDEYNEHHTCKSFPASTRHRLRNLLVLLGNFTT